MNASLLYPLVFEPIYKEKVWGGRSLEKLGRSLPGGSETLIGESWELVDLSTTSASGGGGGAERSVVENGPLAGATLHELMNRFGSALMGDLMPSEFGEYPLLVKFLDARQNLSVQVHPSQQFTEEHEDAYLKSEAWYIVDAEPDAVIYKGVQPGTTPQQFREALEANTVEAVEPLLIKVPVEKGDCHYLPSGTCHALGAGILVAEVQTPSDTTFRVFDWGREGRELHVERALECISFGPPDVSEFEKHIEIDGAYNKITRLVTCEYFVIDKVQCPAGHHQQVNYDEPAIWMIIEGGGVLHCDRGGDVPLQQGRTMMIPPSLSNASLKLDEQTTWLEVTFPAARRVQMA